MNIAEKKLGGGDERLGVGGVGAGGVALGGGGSGGGGKHSKRAQRRARREALVDVLRRGKGVLEASPFDPEGQEDGDAGVVRAGAGGGDVRVSNSAVYLTAWPVPGGINRVSGRGSRVSGGDKGRGGSSGPETRNPRPAPTPPDRLSVSIAPRARR